MRRENEGKCDYEARISGYIDNNSHLKEQVKIVIQGLEKSGVKLRAIRAAEKIEEDNETIERRRR